MQLLSQRKQPKQPLLINFNKTRLSTMKQWSTQKFYVVLLMCSLVAACQSPANISVGEEMNQTAENIQKLRKCPGTPNCVNSSYPNTDEYIAPIEFQGEASEAIEKLQRILGGMKRAELITTTDRYLHAEYTSFLFRFVDDLEVLVDAQESRLELRSASRVGRSDFGVNRKRVEKIRQLFKDS